MLICRGYPMTFLVCFVMIASLLSGQSKGGYWSFDSSMADTAVWDQYRDTGTLQSDAVFRTDGSWSEGNTYLWLDILYQHDCVRIQDSPDLDFTDENIGFSAWIYPLSVGDDIYYILNKGDQYPNPKTTNYALRLSKSNTLELLIRDASNKAWPIASSFEIPAGQWSFVGVFYDFHNKTVYIWNDPDQPPVDTLAYDHSYFENNDPLTIGSWYSGEPDVPSRKDFKGGIDEVKISSRIQDIVMHPVTAVHRMDIAPYYHTMIWNYPNPFNPVTTIELYMPQAGHVDLDILNIRGQQVTILISQTLDAGRHSIDWNANKMQNGSYFCRVRSRNRSIVHKMLLFK